MEITDPQIELFLPKGTVIGAISTIDPLLASIKRQLSTEEKTNKVIKELKIDSNNYIDEPTKRALKELVEEFNTATVINKKPDGSVRLCIDYRSLNKHTISVTAPLQPLDIITSQVGGRKYYSKMDLTKGYYAIKIIEDHVSKKTFVIYCDASFVGLGAAIGHEELAEDGKIQFRLIAYSSRVLTGPEKKWPSFKLEMKCVHYALTKWEHFIYGSPNEAIVYTDMLALTAPKFLNKTNCRLLLSWFMKLSEFNFQLKHVKGENNELADTLSQAPTGSKDIWVIGYQ